MNKIKCILLDIDFTLTGSNKEVSIETANYFSQLNNNYMIVLVSGRNSIYAAEKSISANASPIIIADNGAVIYDYKNNQVFYKNIFDKDTIKLIWDISQKYDIDCVFNALYKRYRNKKYMNERFIGEHGVGINQVDEISDEITQVVIHSSNEENFSKYMEEIKKINNIEVCNGGINDEGECFADIDIKGTSKGNAIKELFRLFNIKKEESICFGDSNNDIPMFQSCGIKVAMKNGTQEIKQAADYITEYSCDEDGVIRFLKSII